MKACTIWLWVNSFSRTFFTGHVRIKLLCLSVNLYWTHKCGFSHCLCGFFYNEQNWLHFMLGDKTLCKHLPYDNRWIASLIFFCHVISDFPLYAFVQTYTEPHRCGFSHYFCYFFGKMYKIVFIPCKEAKHYEIIHHTGISEKLILVNFCQVMSEFNWYAYDKLVQNLMSVYSVTILCDFLW